MKHDYPLELATAAVVVRDVLRGEVLPALQRHVSMLPTAHPARKPLADLAEKVGAAADRLRSALKSRQRQDGRPPARYRKPSSLTVTNCHGYGANRGLLRPPDSGVRA